MSVNQYTLTIPATGSLILEPGNFFFLLSASNAIAILFQTNGAREGFTGITAGLRVQRLKRWANINITGVAGTVVVAYVGDETPREDSTDFVQTIATIAGTVLTSPGAGSANQPIDHADVSVATGVVDTTIAANAARKSIIIGSLSTNAPTTPASLRVQAHPGAATAKGIEIQPGTFIVLQCATALDVYNPDASAQKYWWQEEM